MKKVKYLRAWKDIQEVLGLTVVNEYRFHNTRQWRVDGAILCCRILIEVEGGGFVKGAHTRGAHFVDDMQKYNEMMIDGWHLFRFIPKQMNNGTFLDTLKKFLYNYPCTHQKFNEIQQRLKDI